MDPSTHCENESQNFCKRFANYRAKIRCLCYMSVHNWFVVQTGQTPSHICDWLHRCPSERSHNFSELSENFCNFFFFLESNEKMDDFQPSESQGHWRSCHRHRSRRARKTKALLFGSFFYLKYLCEDWTWNWTTLRI